MPFNVLLSLINDLNSKIWKLSKDYKFSDYNRMLQQAQIDEAIREMKEKLERLPNGIEISNLIDWSKPAV